MVLYNAGGEKMEGMQNSMSGVDRYANTATEAAEIKQSIEEAGPIIRAISRNDELIELLYGHINTLSKELVSVRNEPNSVEEDKDTAPGYTGYSSVASRLNNQSYSLEGLIQKVISLTNQLEI